MNSGEVPFSSSSAEKKEKLELSSFSDSNSLSLKSENDLYQSNQAFVSEDTP